MRLDVHLTPARTDADVIVIVDVLRFTSSAAYALAHGARSVIPCETLDQARAYAGRALLAGEREAHRPTGFDLGNSPLEFTAQAVRGRDIAWTTTNGTRAIAVALTDSGAPRPPVAASAPAIPPAPASVTAPGWHLARNRDLMLASPVNLTAIAALLVPPMRFVMSHLSSGAGDEVVAVVCSGRDGGFALEDAACAGRLVNLLCAQLGDGLTLNDGARASVCIDEAYGEDFARLCRDSEGGRFLREHGFGSDLDACGAFDTLQVVPVWRDGRFVAG